LSLFVSSVCMCLPHQEGFFWPSRLGTDYTVPWFLWYSLLLC
jgi:hypothetical protein